MTRIKSGIHGVADMIPPMSIALRQLRRAAALLLGLAALSSAALLASLLIWAPWRHTPGPAPRTLLASIGADITTAAQSA